DLLQKSIINAATKTISNKYISHHARDLYLAKEAAKFGMKLEGSLIDKKFRESFRNVYKIYHNYGYDSGLSSKEWWSKVIEATFIEAGIDKRDLLPILPMLSTNIYKKFTTSEAYELYDETEYVLNELHNVRKIKLGVISNLDERLGIGKFGVEKPDVKIFKKALELGGIKEGNVKQVLHIGDDEVRDYQGAKNIGINALLIKRTEDTNSKEIIKNTQPNQQEKHHYVIHNLNELFNYL
ncbi:15822_t:CDS:2, partial [Funneliformis caledonium]